MTAPQDLTSFFSPPAPCATLTTFGSETTDILRYAPAADCKPAGLDRMSFYSPGICPSGYASNAVATSDLLTPLKSDESAIACCPTGFKVSTDGYEAHGAPLYWCYSTLNTPTTIISVASTGAPPVTTTIDPKGLVVQAEAVKIRYGSSDDAALASARSESARARETSSFLTSTTGTSTSQSSSSTPSRTFSSTSSSASATSTPSRPNFPRGATAGVSVVAALFLSLLLLTLFMKLRPSARPTWLAAIFSRPPKQLAANRQSTTSVNPSVPFLPRLVQTDPNQPPHYPVRTPLARSSSTHRPNPDLPDQYQLPESDLGPALADPAWQTGIPRNPSPDLAPAPLVVGAAYRPGRNPREGPFADRYRARSGGMYGAIPEEDEEDEEDEADLGVAHGEREVGDEIYYDVDEEPGPNATDEERYEWLERMGQAQSPIRARRESGLSPF
ncbi:MAG: hypothetical protein M1814_001968 [Vezdaea aestivalis]|nr:MAG: hypothetical protein M1814_001968 [Vezdaea aestivalis]